MIARDCLARRCQLLIGHGRCRRMWVLSAPGFLKGFAMRWSSLAVAVALSSAAAAALHADEVVFKNGEHLTGKIDTIESGKATFTSAAGFKADIDLKDVKTFSTDGPVAIKLNDGTVV